MSQSIFPLLIVNTFIPSLWSLPTDELTREYADLNYVKFPIAQGSETFPANLSVSGTTSLGTTNISGPTTSSDLITTTDLIVNNTQIHLGTNAGQTQVANCVAIGTNAGLNQDTDCVAIGTNAGLTQSSRSVAIGRDAGSTNQSYDSFALGYFAGNLNQSNNCVALGALSGASNQKANCVAVGSLAGTDTQGITDGVDEGYSVAIGYSAGQTNQKTNAIAIGSLAALTNQGAFCIAIGSESDGTGVYSIAIGQLATTGSANQSISIGRTATIGTGGDNIAIGSGATRSLAGIKGISLGYNATGSGNDSISIGTDANTSTFTTSVAIGKLATSTANNEITLGTANETIRLNTITPLYTAIPTYTSSMIGHTLRVTPPEDDFVSTLQTIATMSSVPIGVWLFTLKGFFFAQTNTNTLVTLSLYNGAGTRVEPLSYTRYTSGYTDAPYTPLTIVVNNTSVQSYTYRVSVSAGTITSGATSDGFTATRIA